MTDHQRCPACSPNLAVIALHNGPKVVHTLPSAMRDLLHRRVFRSLSSLFLISSLNKNYKEAYTLEKSYLRAKCYSGQPLKGICGHFICSLVADLGCTSLLKAQQHHEPYNVSAISHLPQLGLGDTASFMELQPGVGQWAAKSMRKGTDQGKREGFCHFPNKLLFLFLLLFSKRSLVAGIKSFSLHKFTLF